MKLSKLRPCAVCNGPLPPIWQVVRISMAALDRNATNQTLGLAQMFGGNLGLAEAMGACPDECVMIASDKDPALMTEMHICQNCYLSGPIDLAMAAEKANQEPETEKALG